MIAVGDEPGQQVGSIAFGIPDNPNTWAGNEKAGDEMWRKHGDDDQPCRIVITRKHNDLWVFDGAMNGRQKIWVAGELLALYHKPQAVADGDSSTSTICIDLRATDLDDALTYIKAACNSIAQKVADGEAPPRKESDDGNGGWVRPKEVGLFKHVDPEEVRREAEREAAFEARMEPSRELHEEGLLVRDAVEKAVLLEQLEQPAAEKAKEAEEKAKEAKESTCRGMSVFLTPDRVDRTLTAPCIRTRAALSRHAGAAERVGFPHPRLG